MSNDLKIKVFFSDFFNVTPEVLKKYGAFNISLINDLPLFIDPFLLFNSDESIYIELHRTIVEYMLFLKKKSKMELTSGEIKAWFYFPEIKQNWLGFSDTGNAGRGLGQQFAQNLNEGFISYYSQFGDEELTKGTHIGKLTLWKSGLGKDAISDFTCNLILGYLAEYTEKFSKENIPIEMMDDFVVHKYKFNYLTETWVAKKFKLPKFNNDYILLTPKDILTKDDAWISRKGLVADFNGVLNTIENDTQRAQINNYYKNSLPMFDIQKKDIDYAIDQTLEHFPILFDYYIRQKESESKEAKLASLKKVEDVINSFVKAVPILFNKLNKTKFYEIEPNSFLEGLARVNYLKQVIEEQDGYRIFYDQERRISTEKDLQILFKLTWFASVYSFDSEVNNGRGPADFLVSYGAEDKTIIEFKLAKSTQLERNLLKQAEIYKKAARSINQPIKVILFFNEQEENRVLRILNKHKLRNSENIVLIDASYKESASKV